MKQKKYTKPNLKVHGNLKQITKGIYSGMSDADTGDDIPQPSL